MTTPMTLREKLHEDMERREQYLECIDWLLSDELELVKKVYSKDNVDPQEFEDFLAEAQRAAHQIIYKQPYALGNPKVGPLVIIFQDMCKAGGIMKEKQRKILIEQAQLHFQMTPVEIKLAKAEAKDCEKFGRDHSELRALSNSTARSEDSDAETVVEEYNAV